MKTSKWTGEKKRVEQSFTRQVVDRVNGGEGLYDATWKALMDVYFLEELRAKLTATALLGAAGHDVTPILETIKIKVNS